MAVRRYPPTRVLQIQAQSPMPAIPAFSSTSYLPLLSRTVGLTRSDSKNISFMMYHRKCFQSIRKPFRRFRFPTVRRSIIPGMLMSLVLREVIADSVEVVVRSHGEFERLAAGYPLLTFPCC